MCLDMLDCIHYFALVGLVTVMMLLPFYPERYYIVIFISVIQIIWVRKSEKVKLGCGKYNKHGHTKYSCGYTFFRAEGRSLL